MDDSDEDETFNVEKQPMTYEELVTINNLKDEAVVVELAKHEDTLDRLLKSKNIETSRLTLLLCVFGKSLPMDMHESEPGSVLKLLNILLQCIDNFKMHLETFISYAALNGTADDKKEVVSAIPDIITVGEAFVSKFPSTATAFLSVILMLIDTFLLNAAEDSLSVKDGCVERMDLLRSSIATNMFSGENNKEPSENFRDMSIIPTRDELITLTKPFLRKNIIDGRYQNLEHYLDVQFRLIREDVIGPLRKGISELIHQTNNSNYKKQKIHEIRIYKNVMVTDIRLSNVGTVYILQLSQGALESNWKGLMQGSLVCLTNDAFTNISVGIVAERNNDLLKKGRVGIQVEFSPESLIAGYGSHNFFTMIESTAYFEAGRHILEKLKCIHENELPLEKYFVNCRQQTEHPSYLTSETLFDFSSIMIGPHKSTVLNDNYSPHHSLFHYLLSGSDSSSIGKESFKKVLDDSTWPSEDDLGIDGPQMECFKNCIRNQISIIQGPPGTGKTFLGLKIANLLIKNIRKWQNDEREGAILVVCQTNHALDQLIEGISQFTRDIIRIGNQSRNEKVAQYNLSRKINLELCYSADESMRRKVSKIKSEILMSYRVIVEARSLLDAGVITPEIHDTLMKGHDDIDHWLGIEMINRTLEAKCISQDDLHGKENFKTGETYHRETDEERLTNEVIYKMDDQFNEHRFTMDEKFKRFKNFCLHELKKNMTSNEEWNSLDHTRKSIMRLRAMINDSEKMTVTEVPKAETCIHRIKSKAARWRLYRFWLNCYQKKYLSQLSDCYREYESKLNTDKKHGDEKASECLRKTKIIGATTTGATKYNHLLQNCHIPIVIVEEAAELLEAHIITSLNRSTEQLILIGDHQQLKPSASYYELVKRYNLDVSFYERLIKNGMKFGKLTKQYRMRPDIVDLICPHIYDKLESHESVRHYPNVLGVGKNIFFLDHQHHEDHDLDSTTKVNSYEAEMVLEMARYLLLQGYKGHQITILTTYTGQLYLLRKMIEKIPSYELLEDTRVCTVDNYQGEENNIVLLSFVRSNQEGSVGFLKMDNRVCVALSRAKFGLFCFGNFTLLSERSRLWFKIVETLKRYSNIGTELPLYCQIHPKTTTQVTAIEDFEIVPEGGCSLPCNQLLECGHNCPKKCHNYHHNLIKCFEKCLKIVRSCPERHSCDQLCHGSSSCDPCERIVHFDSPCGHTVSTSCKDVEKLEGSDDNLMALCKLRCDEPLNCGHTCDKTCHGSSSCDPCEIMVHLDSPCGHTVSTRCKNKEELKGNDERLSALCQQRCAQPLNCGHMCTGECVKCYPRRIHDVCKEIKLRELFCGHVVELACNEKDPVCSKRCESRCDHHRCEHNCGDELCNHICKEPCMQKCRHSKCTKLCSEPCNKQLCKKPCLKKLKCKHDCYGVCGEPCPSECLKCNPEQFKDLSFGGDENMSSRFVKLIDCGHLVEVNTLDSLVTASEKDKPVKLLSRCPVCDTSIRNTFCYKTSIRVFMNHVEKVKIKRLDQIKYHNADFVALERVFRELCFQRFIDGSLQPLWRKLADRCKINNQGTTKEYVKFTTDLISLLEDNRDLSKKHLVLSRHAYRLAKWLLHNIEHATMTQMNEFAYELAKHVTVAEYTADVDADKNFNVTALLCVRNQRQQETDAESEIHQKSLKKRGDILKGLPESNHSRTYYRCKNEHVFGIAKYFDYQQGVKCPHCE